MSHRPRDADTPPKDDPHQKVSTRMQFPRLGGAKSPTTPETLAAATPAAGPAPLPTAPSAPAIPSVAALSQFDTGPAMDAEMARNVRFNVATPEGYHFPQVEDYVDQVANTLSWHENARYAMARAVHDLQVELDHAIYDSQRLRTEIELFKVQGSPMVNADGSYKTESQQAAEAATAEHARLLQAELDAAVSRIAELEAEIGRARTYVATQDGHVAQFQAQAAQAAAAAQDAEARAAAALERAQVAETRLAEAEQVILALQQENEALLTGVAPPGAPVATSVSAPTVEAAADEAHLTGPEADFPHAPVAAGEHPIEDAVEYAPEPVAPAAVEYDHGTAPAPVAQPGDYGDPHASGDADGYLAVDEDAPVSVPVIPVDSELPPGVSLPASAPVAQYGPVAPGIPLANPGVPAHVWAPELDAQPDPALSSAPVALDPDSVPQPRLHRP